MKKLIKIFLICTLMLFALCITASAATEGYYTYTVSNNEATITRVSSSISGAVTIPSTLDGYHVTTIGYRAFYSCTKLTSIEIPDSVTTIDVYAFYNCTGLTSVEIPDSVTTIGGSAFENTAWYNNQSDGIIYAGKVLYGYKGTMPSKTKISVDEGTKGIANSAFRGCNGLTSVVIPNSVTCIGVSAFEGCDALEEMTIPFIGNKRGATGLSGVFGYIFGYEKEGYDGAWQYRDEDGYDWYYYVPESLKKVTVTDISAVPDNAFMDCRNLIEINFEKSLTSIGKASFRYCRNLTSIVIPKGVITIGNYAFDDCEGLTNIKIPETVTTIGSNVFSYCENITSVVIPDSVTTIGSSAFSPCKGLICVVIGDDVTQIGHEAFSGCSNLESIVLGDGVTIIDDYVFNNCINLSNVYYRGTKAQWESISIGKNNNYLTTANITYDVRKVTFFNSNGDTVNKKWIEAGDKLPSGIELEVQEGKRATFYTDKECTKLFDMSTEITEDTVLYCTLKDAYCTYRFLNGDGSVMLEKTVEYGSTLNEKPSTTPTKASTAQYTYTFSKWDGYTQGMTITKDMTFTPVFNSIVNKYTYKFLNEDGSVYYEKTADYGTEITKPANPTKASTAQYSYVFSKWNGYTDGMTVAEDITFTPEFTSTVNKYTYKFVDWDGSIILEKTEEYGKTIESPVNVPVRPATQQYIYIFDKWTGFIENMPLTKNVTFTANYKTVTNQYTYKFLNEDGSVYYEKTADYGTEITKPANPTKAATAQYTYTFSKWDGYTQGMTITKDMTFTPVFNSTVNKYTYKFLNEDGSVYFEKTADYGTEITKPANPTKTSTAQYSYVFSKWNGYTDGMTLTENVEFIPVFDVEIKQYTYKFSNDDGTVLKEKIADYGSVIELPQTPEKPADEKYTYNFNKWQGYSEGMTLTENVEFTAVYDAIYRQNIQVVGSKNVIVGDNLTEEVVFATLKPVNYLICEIVYPDMIELNSITPRDFKYASQESLKNKDGFNYLTVICQYADDETTVPENTSINPFNLSFTVSKTAKPKEIEIKFGEDTYLSGEEDYPFENKINAKIEILPKLASSITITGSDTIHEPTRFTAEVYPDYTTDKTIEWSVDDETIATISKEGILTPVKNGSVKITATAVGGSYITKSVSVYRNAYVDSLKSDVGVWNKEFYPDIKEYTIYVTEDTETISITPLFTTGTLKYNDTILIKSRARKFELSDNETTINLARSDTGYLDCTYTIKVIKKPGLKNETINAESFKEDCINILVYNNNAVRIEETEDITITIPEKVSSYKILYWESLANLKPAYAPIIKEL